MPPDQALNLSLHVNQPSAAVLFQGLSILLKKSVPFIIRTQAGAMGRYLAENTQPVAGLVPANTPQDIDGGSLKARDLGRGAVRRDIARVYSPPSRAFSAIKNQVGNSFAKEFYALLKQGRIEEAKAVIRAAGVAVDMEIMKWDDGALHRSVRNRRGRVPKNTRTQTVNDGDALKQYIKRIEDRVGWAKAAWIIAAMQIPDAKGFSKVRMWIKKHADSPGTGEDRTRNTRHPHVVLTSRVPYADTVLPARQYERAFRQFELNIIASVKIAALKILQKKRNQNRS